MNIEEVIAMRVYLCGPMAGCTDEEAGEWRKAATVHLNGFGITTLDPMDRDYRYTEYGDDPESVLPALVEEDKIDIEMADVVLVNYTQPSTGTAMEIILAWMRNKRVIVVNPLGLQLSPWIHYHAHEVYGSMHEAYEHIVKFNKRTTA
jgi:nucleoside 2-deoxyribosyltransferase